MPTIFSEGIFARFEDQFRPFVAELDIPESVFTRRDVEVPSHKYAELLETVARHANPHIGLDLGESLEPRDLGVMGHAMSASATVGEALSVVSRYLYVLSQSNTMRLDIGELDHVHHPDTVRKKFPTSIGRVLSRPFREHQEALQCIRL
jgi:hypothetical protein